MVLLIRGQAFRMENEPMLKVQFKGFRPLYRPGMVIGVRSVAVLPRPTWLGNAVVFGLSGWGLR